MPGLKRAASIVVSAAPVAKRPYKRAKADKFKPRLYAPVRRAEAKHKVIAQTATFDTTGIVYIYNGIGQGTNDDERIGGLVNHREFTMRYNFRSIASGASIRVITGIWKQALSPNPIIDDILYATGIPNGPYFTSPYNRDKQTCYEILADDVYDCNTPGTLNPAIPSFVEWSKSFQRGVKVNKSQEYYSQNGADVSNWQYFSIFVTNNTPAVVIGDFCMEQIYTDA